MTSAISARGLRKSYRDMRAVDDIDLTIHRGEIFALLGPNGAGKTTTVEILEGHRERDGGDVSVLGTDPGTAGRAWRARLGIVLQTASDVAELTVTETVRHFAGYYPRPTDTDEVIDAVGLTEKAGSRIRALSGGQRRRLDVALGIIGNPELVFLDEPTTGFDPKARRQFWSLIERLSDDGTTIVLTTHYLDEAEALADRLAVIVRGRIVAEGDPHSLGGRATADVTVSWADDRGSHEVRTPNPDAYVARHVAANGSMPGLQVRRPSLEDVYLELIGELS
ncbi:MAG: ABC transporter ATP-binding protein [Thermocrispum sp.]